MFKRVCIFARDLYGASGSGKLEQIHKFAIEKGYVITGSFANEAEMLANRNDYDAVLVCGEKVNTDAEVIDVSF